MGKEFNTKSGATIKKILSRYVKSYPNKKIGIESFSTFKDNFKTLQNELTKAFDENREEEYFKNKVAQFLNKTLYIDKRYSINTEGRIDYAISKNDFVEIIFEFKSPQNKVEMITEEVLNKKAFQEVIKYYYDEKQKNNNYVKNIIVSDTLNWFIFDATDFSKTLPKSIAKLCNKFNSNETDFNTTDKLYEAIGKELQSKNVEFDYLYFNILNIKSDPAILNLYRILHPDFLLREYDPKDSNELNKNFYDELLWILGLHETEEGIIEPNNNKNAIINQTIYRLIEYKDYSEEKAKGCAFELVITWLNRILFLKLFEGQLLAFNANNEDYTFITSKTIPDFDSLNELFFEVLGKPLDMRSERHKNPNVPYLNSSLFEKSKIEIQEFFISSLPNDIELEIYKKTSLNKWPKYKNLKQQKTLAYFLDFLDSYDFSSTNSSDEFVDEKKEIINSSVLGLIFEKLNGYKDGSFYTPGFITKYMAEKTLDKTILQKFSDVEQNKFTSISELADYIGRDNWKADRRDYYNSIINEIKICDPAVGSGHYLVSVLNHLIAVKSQLGLLYADNKPVAIDNEEDNLIIYTDLNKDKIFSYSKAEKSTHAIQELIFKEKQSIIENQIFAVDINPKSVYICQLRLWIELLKNTFYYENGTMEILPNIDINIKTGNSLISKYPIKIGKSILDDVDGRTKVATTIKEYKQAVQDYKHSASKETKKIVNEKLAKLKGDIQEVVEGFLFKEDKKSEILLKEIAKLRKEQKKITSLEANEKIAKQISEKSKQITLQTLGDIKDSNIFENSMEWMIEFPELLNEDGSFQGFDIVIANPPYIDSEAMVNSGQTEFRDFIIKNYKIARGNWDIYIAFFNLAFRLINEKGNLSFITPDKWLSKPFGMELRKTYLDNISAVARAGRDVFTSAKVDSILTFISKSTTTKIEVLNCIDKKFKTLHKIDKKDFEEPYILDFIFSEQLSILLKMEKDNIKLSDYTVCENACATSDCYDLKDILKNLENQKITSKHLKVINTGTVGKYISRWGEKEMTYLKDRYLYPIVDEEDFNKSFKNSYATKTFMPKIIIKGLTLLDACFDFDGRVIPGKSTLVICEKDINKLKFIAAIINSKLPLFYIKEKYASSSYNGGINFTKDMINNFPIPKITDADQKKLVNLVDTILDTKNKNPNADTSSIETQIDDEVYKLYSITPQEKNIIEANE